MLKVNKNIFLKENELKFEFIRASGPGGQKVNKTSTAVQLRFDVLNSKSLNNYAKESLLRDAASKITNNGILIIEAKRFRTQERNKQDAINRLISIIRKCIQVKKRRRKTIVPKSVIEARLDRKKRRSHTKKLRKSVNRNIE